MGGSFLFVTWQGGGNVHPLVALGTHLVAQGHRVRVLGPASLARRFESEGIGLIAYREGEARGDDAFRALADDVVAEAVRDKTDAVVVDFMQPHALTGAETLDLPIAAYVHTLYQRQAIGQRSPMNMYGNVDKVNALREQLGLDPLERISDLLDRTARVLVFTLRELDRPEEPVAENVRYVGPLVEAAGDDAGWRPNGSSDDGPLVHVSMGTVAGADQTAPVIQRLLDAFADRPVRVHVAVCTPEVATWDGAVVDPSSLRAPSNASVTGYVRHAAVLPHASAFVTHAGLSSIGSALTFGVPMVCVPITNEQPANAEHVAAFGAGIALTPDDATVDALHVATRDVLTNASYGEVAGRAAASIRSDPPAERAVAELEQLLDG